MKNTSILIVGAGAVGLVLGYHFSLGAADVSFYIRENRILSFQSAQTLYCYDDSKLKSFSKFSTVSNLEEISNAEYDFIIVTLDGIKCFSDEGCILLNQLANSIRSKNTVIVIGGVGVGLREHVLNITCLPKERVIQGMFAILSHQVENAELPVVAPTNYENLNKASIAYRHVGGDVGFHIVSSLSSASHEFANAYNRCKISRCILIGRELHEIITNSFFPFTAVCEIAGWPNIDVLTKNKPLWNLCCQAQREIIGLPQHGRLGKFLSYVLRDGFLKLILKKLESNCLPLDFHAFNKFHHGFKVREQDIQVMRNCVLSGTSQGHSMVSLKLILSYL